MNITYGVIEEIYYMGHICRKSYGIAAYADADRDGTATIVASISDIMSDLQSLEELVALCNRMELSLCHLIDIVEDFLESE